MKSEPLKMTDDQRRAYGYAKTLVEFQNVGVGPDRNLNWVRNIVNNIRELCKDETSIELDNYPTSFVKKCEDVMK